MDARLKFVLLLPLRVWLVIMMAAWYWFTEDELPGRPQRRRGERVRPPGTRCVNSRSGTTFFEDGK